MITSKWFTNHHKDRQQCCVINCTSSDYLPGTSGVPQGSILGPFLFLVYINDLPSMIDNTIARFADDSKCSNVINSTNDCVSLKNDPNSLQTWCRDWQLRFNSSKCEVQSVTRKQNPLFSITKLDVFPCPMYSSQKDLGVTVTSDLKWNRHINNITSKGYKTLGFLQRGHLSRL